MAEGEELRQRVILDTASFEQGIAQMRAGLGQLAQAVIQSNQAMTQGSQQAVQTTQQAAQATRQLADGWRVVSEANQQSAVLGRQAAQQQAQAQAQAAQQTAQAATQAATAAAESARKAALAAKIQIPVQLDTTKAEADFAALQKRLQAESAASAVRPSTATQVAGGPGLRTEFARIDNTRAQVNAATQRSQEQLAAGATRASRQIRDANVEAAASFGSIHDTSKTAAREVALFIEHLATGTFTTRSFNYELSYLASAIVPIGGYLVAAGVAVYALTKAFLNSGTSAEDLQKQYQDLQSELGDLAKAYQTVSQAQQGAITGRGAQVGTSEATNLRSQLDQLKQHRDDLAGQGSALGNVLGTFGGVSNEQTASIKQLIDQYEHGQLSAENFAEAMEQFARTAVPDAAKAIRDFSSDLLQTDAKIATTQGTLRAASLSLQTFKFTTLTAEMAAQADELIKLETAYATTTGAARELIGLRLDDLRSRQLHDEQQAVTELGQRYTEQFDKIRAAMQQTIAPSSGAGVAAGSPAAAVAPTQAIDQATAKTAELQQQIGKVFAEWRAGNGTISSMVQQLRELSASAPSALHDKLQELISDLIAIDEKAAHANESVTALGAGITSDEFDNLNAAVAKAGEQLAYLRTPAGQAGRAFHDTNTAAHELSEQLGRPFSLAQFKELPENVQNAGRAIAGLKSDMADTQATTGLKQQLTDVNAQADALAQGGSLTAAGRQATTLAQALSQLHLTPAQLNAAGLTRFVDQLSAANERLYQVGQQQKVIAQTQAQQGQNVAALLPAGRQRAEAQALTALGKDFAPRGAAPITTTTQAMAALNAQMATLTTDQRTAVEQFASMSEAAATITLGKDLDNQLDQAKLSLQYAGQESQEYRVQAQLLQIKNQYSAEDAKNAEDEVNKIQAANEALRQGNILRQQQQQNAETRAKIQAAGNLPDILSQQFLGTPSEQTRVEATTRENVAKGQPEGVARQQAEQAEALNTQLAITQELLPSIADQMAQVAQTAMFEGPEAAARQFIQTMAEMAIKLGILIILQATFNALSGGTAGATGAAAGAPATANPAAGGGTAGGMFSFGRAQAGGPVRRGQRTAVAEDSKTELFLPDSLRAQPLAASLSPAAMAAATGIREPDVRNLSRSRGGRALMGLLAASGEQPTGARRSGVQLLGAQGPQLFVPPEDGTVLNNQDLRRIEGSPSGRAMLRRLGRAAGGPVSRGQPYITGERDEELFVPSRLEQHPIVLFGRQTTQAQPHDVRENFRRLGQIEVPVDDRFTIPARLGNVAAAHRGIVSSKRVDQVVVGDQAVLARHDLASAPIRIRDGVDSFKALVNDQKRFSGDREIHLLRDAEAIHQAPSFALPPREVLAPTLPAMPAPSVAPSVAALPMTRAAPFHEALSLGSRPFGDGLPLAIGQRAFKLHRSTFDVHQPSSIDGMHVQATELAAIVQAIAPGSAPAAVAGMLAEGAAAPAGDGGTPAAAGGTPAAAVTALAPGGSLRAGQQAIVGERGPELMLRGRLAEAARTGRLEQAMSQLRATPPQDLPVVIGARGQERIISDRSAEVLSNDDFRRLSSTRAGQRMLAQIGAAPPPALVTSQQKPGTDQVRHLAAGTIDTTQMLSSGGSSRSQPQQVVVNNAPPEFRVIDQRPAGSPPIEQSSQMGSDGRMIITAMVRSATAEMLKSGEHQSVMRNVYGISPRPRA